MEGKSLKEYKFKKKKNSLAQVQFWLCAETPVSSTIRVIPSLPRQLNLS